VTCLECASAAIRDPSDRDRDQVLKRMASLGCINCTRTTYRMGVHALDHQCEAFEPAVSAVVSARRRWIDKNRTTA
jgi:hypothetical protein